MSDLSDYILPDESGNYLISITPLPLQVKQGKSTPFSRPLPLQSGHISISLLFTLTTPFPLQTMQVRSLFKYALPSPLQYAQITAREETLTVPAPEQTEHLVLLLEGISPVPLQNPHL